MYCFTSSLNISERKEDCSKYVKQNKKGKKLKKTTKRSTSAVTVTKTNTVEEESVVKKTKKGIFSNKLNSIRYKVISTHFKLFNTFF